MQIKKIILIGCFITMFVLYFGGCSFQSEIKQEDGSKEELPNNIIEDMNNQSDGQNNQSQNTDSKEEESNEELSTESNSGDTEQVEIQDAEIISSARVRKKIFDLLQIDSVKTVYQKKYQAMSQKVLNQYKGKRKYTFEKPLFVMNPFGTIENGLYIYFETQELCNLSYTISIDHEEIADFKQTLYSDESGDEVLVHEGMIIGLIAGVKNYVRFSLMDEQQKIVQEKVFCINLENQENNYQPIYKTDITANHGESVDDFFVAFSEQASKRASINMIDGQGTLRAVLPLEAAGINLDMVIMNEHMIYPIDEKHIVRMNRFGHMEEMLVLEDYRYENHLMYKEEQNSLYFIGSKEDRDSAEDILVRIDLDTKEITVVVDCRELLTEIYERAQKSKKKHWIHINSFDLMDEENVLLSSRELSSILHFSNLSENAELDYIISDQLIWKDSSYSDIVYQALGSFVPFAGQNQIVISTNDKRLIKGQYYILMLNQNLGSSPSWPEFDWTQLEGIATEETPLAERESSFYKVFVDENTKTFTLAERIGLPFGEHLGSVQKWKENYILFSSQSEDNSPFYEYDENGKLLEQYLCLDDEQLFHQVKKYSFSNFWFNKSLF